MHVTFSTSGAPSHRTAPSGGPQPPRSPRRPGDAPARPAAPSAAATDCQQAAVTARHRRRSHHWTAEHRQLPGQRHRTACGDRPGRETAGQRPAALPSRPASHRAGAGIPGLRRQRQADKKAPGLPEEARTSTTEPLPGASLTIKPRRGTTMTSRIQRAGDTVRRLASFWTPAVHGLLRHLQAAGSRPAPAGHRGRNGTPHLDRRRVRPRRLGKDRPRGRPPPLGGVPAPPP
jgi:hypothetical protein